MKPGRRDRHSKIAFTVMGLILIFYGIAAIMENRWTYGNYWGGQVFAPVTILLGLLLIYIALFRHDEFKKPSVDKRGRRIRFPADDFRKW